MNELWQRSTPEERLLFACMRQEWSGPWPERTAMLAARALDWPRVLAIAVRHQVAPLVLENLSRTDGALAAVPADVVAGFHHETMRNMAAKRTMAAKLVEVVAWLASHGVRAMLIKGTSLDRLVWREPWMTVSGDVDLMIDAEQGEVPREVAARGWQLNHEQPAVDLQCTPHPDLTMGGVLRLDFTGIWARATEVEVGDDRARVMDLEDELLAACVQSCRKRFFRLKSLAELGELASRADVDWDAFAGRARAAGCHGIAYAALFAAELAVGIRLPDALQHSLRVAGPRAALLRALARRRSWSGLESTTDARRALLMPYAAHTWPQLARSLPALIRRRSYRKPRAGR